MVDIKPFVGELIGEIVPVELSYNDNFINPPAAVITETENRSEIIIGNHERVSRISVQLDIYAENALSLEEISAQVSSILTLHGFKRSFSEVIYGEKYPRRCIRYDLGVDEASGRIISL